VIQSTYEAVQLASLRDAEGRHHAELEWAPMAGSVEYRVYTAAESAGRMWIVPPALLPWVWPGVGVGSGTGSRPDLRIG